MREKEQGEKRRRTFMPEGRTGGSVTSSTSRRGLTSTPKSASGMVSIGFLRAFMMLGRLAYLSRQPPK
jgi:hypothetical protein